MRLPELADIGLSDKGWILMADNKRHPKAWATADEEGRLRPAATATRPCCLKPVKVRLVPISDYDKWMHRLAHPIICWLDDCCCAAVLGDDYEPAIFCESETGPYCQACWDQLCMEFE